jgi:trans-aconitate methyltransferase
MVRHLTADTAHLPQVRVSLGDATDPRPPGAPYDVIASSLVLFFLTDPVTSLTRWRALLRPSGRLGIAKFQPWRATWQALDELYDEYAGELSRSASQEDAFTTDAGVESLLDGAGFGGVRTESATYGIRFDSVEQWRDWSVGTSMGGLWTRTPEDAHPEILRRATEILEAARDDTGQIVVEVDARYTFGIA